MDKARYTNDRGDVKTLQIRKSGSSLEEGAEWYGVQGKYHDLFCAHCDAPVHYSQGSQSIAGSSLNGQSPYFATDPKAQHADDCEWGLKKKVNPPRFVDKTKGYRVHINVQGYSDLFNSASGAYARDAKGRIVAQEKDLKDRERVVIHNVSDFASFLQKKDMDRIAKSRVVFRNQVLDWNDFFFRYGKPSRYKSLAEELSTRSKNTEPRFGLFEVRTIKPDYIIRNGLYDIACEDVPNQDICPNGNPYYIRPSISLRKGNDTMAITQFEGFEHRFLVLAHVKANRVEEDHRTIDYLNLVVTKSSQIMAADVEEIYKKRMATKLSMPKPAPAP